MSDLTTATGRTRTKASSVAAAGAVAVVASLVLNVVIARAALAAGASEDFTALTFGAYGFLTVIGVLLGLLGWVLVRRTANAASTLRWLVPTVLVVSIVPDVLVGLSDQPGVSWGAVGALVLMHVVTTIVAVAAFARFLPARGAR